jgi:hypothetical protein
MLITYFLVKKLTNYLFRITEKPEFFLNLFLWSRTLDTEPEPEQEPELVKSRNLNRDRKKVTVLQHCLKAYTHNIDNLDKLDIDKLEILDNHDNLDNLDLYCATVLPQC